MHVVVILLLLSSCSTGDAVKCVKGCLSGVVDAPRPVGIPKGLIDHLLKQAENAHREAREERACEFLEANSGNCSLIANPGPDYLEGK